MALYAFRRVYIVELLLLLVFFYHCSLGNVIPATKMTALDGESWLYETFADSEGEEEFLRFRRDAEGSGDDDSGKFENILDVESTGASDKTAAQDGLTDIYEMDMRTQSIHQLTKSASIDTSPSYSHDGKSIVFNSDRGGTQQLYVMDADGSNVRRISYGDGRYATPVWSPRGDIIAFTKMANGQFILGL